jgi:hypothetical protein
MTVVATTAARYSTEDPTAYKGAAPAGSLKLQEVQGSGYESLLKRYFGPDFEMEHRCDHLQNYRIHRMVVTLPDPSDPHLADSFDSYLASVELALAQDSYLTDQYWVPWVEKRRQERAEQRVTLNNAPAAPLLVVNSGPAGDQQDVLDQPGIVLFRKPHLQSPPSDGAKDELLFLLLVPETPTTGVRSATLRKAFEQAADLGCDEESDGPQAIRILGPSFSGAAASLASGIEAWQSGHKSQFKIISGSATNSDTRRLLLRVPNVSFSSTVLPDEALEDFYQYLSRKFTAQRIAVLTESNTSYGQGRKRPLDAGLDVSETCPPDAGLNMSETGPPDGDLNASETGAPDAGLALSETRLQLSFPLHVSQLGAEYEKARSRSASSSALEGAGTLLSLNLLEEGEPRDVVPAMSALTKYNSDLSLINTLAVIARADFNPVGILATDTRDEVFLAQVVKRQAPDAQLFLMEAELLFSHPALANDMRGALVVSRYPLYNLNQLWTSPPQKSPRVQFPTGSSQGIYNAAIFHLRGLGTGQAPSQKRLPTPLEYGEPFAANSRRPPLWVGMVGHYGIWPIGTLGRNGSLNRQAFITQTAHWMGLATAQNEPSRVNWCEVEKYTEPSVPSDEPPRLVVPQGRLHILAAGLLFAIIAWHAAHWLVAGAQGSGSLLGSQRVYEWVQRFYTGAEPLICSIPKELKAGSRRQRAYASLLLVGWQALIAIYLAVLAPVIAPLIAEKKLVPQDPQLAPLGVPSKLALIFCAISVLAFVLLVVSLYARVWKVTSIPVDENTRFKAIKRFFPLYWLAGAALMLFSVFYFLDVAFASDGPAQVFLWVRATNWLSGISPTLPLAFLGMSAYATTWVNLYRLVGVRYPLHTGDGKGEETLQLVTLLPDIEMLKEAEKRAESVMNGERIVGGVRVLIFLIVTATAIVIFAIRTNVEPDSWTWLVRVLLALLIVAIVHGLVLLVQIWRTIRNTVDQLAGHSVVSTLKDMQAMLAAMLGLHSYLASSRSEQVLATARTQFAVLKEWAKDEPTHPPQACTTLTEATQVAVDKLRGSTWPSYKGSGWVRPAAELVALQVVRTLGRRIAMIRALIGVLTIDALILLLITRLYPFQPHGLLSALSWFLLLTVVIVSVWSLVGLERHAILSYASGSEPGKVSWDASFVLHLILFAVLPIIALVAAHFPEVGGPIFDSLQPLIRSAR